MVTNIKYINANHRGKYEKSVMGWQQVVVEDGIQRIGADGIGFTARHSNGNMVMLLVDIKRR